MTKNLVIAKVLSQNSVFDGTITVGNTTPTTIITSSSIAVGNSTVNSVANSINIRLSNSTVTFDISKPTAAEVTSTDYFLGSDGTWQQIDGVDANNALYLGGVAAADYQTEAGLSANVAELTANAQ